MNRVEVVLRPPVRRVVRVLAPPPGAPEQLDKEDVVRAAAALQAGDADLFSSLGAGVESAMPCRTLKRLARQSR
ncbi:hypothetical protein ACWGDS_37760 [Streptomyces sp. NPDC055059]